MRYRNGQDGNVTQTSRLQRLWDLEMDRTVMLLSKHQSVDLQTVQHRNGQDNNVTQTSRLQRLWGPEMDRTVLLLSNRQ